MRIKSRLTLSHLSMVIVPVVILGAVLGFLFIDQLDQLNTVAQEQGLNVIERKMAETLENAAQEKLSLISGMRKQQLLSYFKQQLDDLVALGAMRDIETLYSAMADSLVKTGNNSGFRFGYQIGHLRDALGISRPGPD